MLVIFLAVVFFSPFAKADSCNTDCNSQCCKEIRITPFDRNDVCDPACKVTCEANKKICQGTGVSLPSAPSVVNEVVKALQQSCASGFEVVTKYVILSQGFYP